MSFNIKTILIGLGKMGCGYDLNIEFKKNIPQSSSKIISHARAIDCHPDYNFLAAIDRKIESINNFKLKYNVPTFRSVNSFLDSIKTKVDLVIICTDPGNQPFLVEEIIYKIKPKMLLLEKPISISFNEAKNLENLFKLEDAPIVAVNYVRNFLPLIKIWKEKLLNKSLGEFTYGHIVYGKGLLTNGCHFINLAQFLLGKFKFEKKIEEQNFKYDYDKEVSFTLRLCENNALMNIYSIGKSMLRAGEIDLWFEKGRLCLKNNGESLLFWPRLKSSSAFENYDSLSLESQIFPTEISKCQYYVLDSIKDAFSLNSQISNKFNFKESLDTMELIHQILNS